MTLNLEESSWTRVSLGDVAAASKEKVDPSDGSVERYIGGEHMDTDDLKIHRWGDIGTVDLGPAFHRRFRPGQVLYGSRRTYLRKVAVADFDGVCANTTFVVGTRDERTLLQEFLPFIMTSEPFHAFAIAESKGSVNPYVNWSDIERYEFDLPPVPEQGRIADLLWAIERHRLNLRGSRSAAARLLETDRATMFEVESDLVHCREAFEITIGRQRSPKHQFGDHIVNYLRSANVTSHGIDVRDVKTMNFEPAAQTRFQLRHSDVLVSEASASFSAVGMPAVWDSVLPGVTCFQNTLLRYRAIPGVTLPGFVEQYCRWAFETGAFLEVSSGTNIRHIGVGGAESMSVRLPTLREQEAFLARTASLDSALDALDAEEGAIDEARASAVAEVFGGN